MSRTACWGTNRLDVDIANVYMGYGSCHDMIHHQHGFQVSLEALQAIVSFDYNYIRQVALELYPSEGLTEYGYERLFSYGITMDMMYKAKSLLTQEIWMCSDNTYQHIYDEILKDVPMKAQYKMSPISIVFRNLSDKESELKAIEWFAQIKPFINKNYQDPCVKYKCDDGNVLCGDGRYSYMYIGYTKPKELADIANRAISIMREANDYSNNNDQYTEMYMCLSDEDKIARRKIEYEEREENRKRIDDLIESLSFQ